VYIPGQIVCVEVVIKQVVEIIVFFDAHIAVMFPGFLTHFQVSVKRHHAFKAEFSFE